MEEYRIREDIIIVREEETPIYVPEVLINADLHLYASLMGKGSYILKTSKNPLIICKSCGGDGCIECKEVGLRKGECVDLKYVAQMFIEIDKQKQKTIWKLQQSRP